MTVQCQSIGGSMGYNKSCPNHGDTSCQVSCQDPTNANTCALLGALLVDGSPCGMLFSVASPQRIDVYVLGRLWWNMQWRKVSARWRDGHNKGNSLLLAPILIFPCVHQACETGMVFAESTDCDSRYYCYRHCNVVPIMGVR